MRNICKLFLTVLLAAAALASCQIEPVTDPSEEEGTGILLKLATGDMDLLTKAASTRPGNDDGSDFNENSLGENVDIFFFPENAGDNVASVKNLRYSVGAGGFVRLPVSMGDIYTIFGSTAPGSKADVYVVANYNGATAIDHSQHYTLAQLKALQLAKADWGTFPQTNFVMAGRATITLTNPSGNTPAQAVDTLRRVAAKLSFKLTVADEIVVENITRDHNGDIADKTLDRWHPIKEAMTIYLQYGMNYARLGGEPQKVPANPKSTGASDSLYTYKANKLVETTSTINRHRTIIDALEKVQTGTDSNGHPIYEWNLESHEAYLDVPVYDTKYLHYEQVWNEVSGEYVEVGALTGQNGPFYTYPVTWDPGVQTEPFLKLIIPWNNGSRTKYYYYKIPFSGTSIEANNWYEITLDVQVLGGEDELPVPLEAYYKVVDWTPGTEASAETVAARFLSVPKTEWIMYNQDELEIPITSSHDVQIVGYQVKSSGTAVGNAFAAADKYTDGEPRAAAWIGSDPQIYNPFTSTLITTGLTNETTVGTVYATKPNYNANTLGTPVPATIDATSWFDAAEITRDKIVLRHTLNNNLSTSGYDITSYWIRIRVRHKDAPDDFYSDIIIEQRPAIYIDPDQNPDDGYYISDRDYYIGSHKGYVYINNAQGTTDNWNLVRGLDGSNKNVNMYVINVSVLEASSDYVLGDPRVQDTNNLDYEFSRAVSVQGGQRRLVNYYPTQRTDAYKNMIAPKLRVASSYGVCGSVISKEDAEYRCASYQEAGYPAGRWRVPTRAEVEFITKLSAQGVIPTLFNVFGGSSTSRYWCATGSVTVNSEGTLNDASYDNAFVRCVYDEWFWENTSHATVDKSTFTWGDEKREDVVRTKALY